MHSMWLDWVPQYLIQILLNKQFGYPAIPTTIDALEQVMVIRVYPWQQVSARGLPVLDDYVIRFGAPSPTPDTYDLDFWGVFGRTSAYIEPYGLVQKLSDEWIYHPDIGFLRLKNGQILD